MTATCARPICRHGRAYSRDGVADGIGMFVNGADEARTRQLPGRRRPFRVSVGYQMWRLWRSRHAAGTRPAALTATVR